jgi:hypothetical protein
MMEGDGAELMKEMNGDGERWNAELNGMAEDREASGGSQRRSTSFWSGSGGKEGSSFGDSK